ncbi:hypothetical protein BCR43DRAFT_488857 [Syncephalastrum racemosum]|uniref:Smr domain-containing protein n=1 Tax=Syncephalastrum racemosum TaxID=13706 RepID=A0A1X2HJA2_SYNRA|nr:hypothetical protein BCR43DRAFT_488857 [Syncephalastrum racemosum]
MGRLQDNQYSSRSTRKNRKQTESKNNEGLEKLQSVFCPPLDAALVQAIWNDTQNYTASYNMLKELAHEASAVLESTGTSEEQQNESDDIFQKEQDLLLNEEHDDLNFLFKCFPTLTKDELLNTLKAQGNDLEKATDILLNNVFLEEQSETSTSGSLTDEEQDINNSSQKKKNKKKNNKVVWTNGLMTGPRRLEHESNEASLATVPFNVWHQYDDQVNTIQHVFPSVQRSVILGCVQRARGNIIASVRALLEKEKKPHIELQQWQQIRDMDDIESRLRPILADRTPQEIHGLAAGVTVANMNTKPPPTVEQQVEEAVHFALNFDREQQELADRMKQLSLQASFKADLKDVATIPEYLLLNNRDNYAEDDPEECRSMAMSCIMQRNELFRRAAESYRRSRNKGAEGGIAFYYSDNARQLDKQAKEWNMRAARALVRGHRLEHNDDHLLDLHGLSVSEAQTLLKEGVTQWWSRSQMQSPRKRFQPLRVVTGAGRHSKYGESKLLPSALRLLKQEGWRTEVPYPGCILVRGPMT